MHRTQTQEKDDLKSEAWCEPIGRLPFIAQPFFRHIRHKCACAGDVALVASCWRVKQQKRCRACRSAF